MLRELAKALYSSTSWGIRSLSRSIPLKSRGNCRARISERFGGFDAEAPAGAPVRAGADVGAKVPARQRADATAGLYCGASLPLTGGARAPAPPLKG